MTADSTVSSIHWQVSNFDELGTGQLYQLLQLRQDVFIIEQDCIYQDMDHLDSCSSHLLGYENKKLVAYLRIVPPGEKFRETSLGRIVVAAGCRCRGIGTELVRKGLEYAIRLYENESVRIEAQSQLQVFYEKLDFKKASEIYDLDGIPHIQMVRARTR